jgi:hypothetical protein
MSKIGYIDLMAVLLRREQRLDILFEWTSISSASFHTAFRSLREKIYSILLRDQRQGCFRYREEYDGLLCILVARNNSNFDEIRRGDCHRCGVASSAQAIQEVVD